MKLINLTEMAREAKVCPKCGKKITGNHYWYKGEWKCKKEKEGAAPAEQKPVVQKDMDPGTSAKDEVVPEWHPTFSDEAEIADSVLPYLEAEIEKLNKRARRTGAPEVHLHKIGEPIFKEIKTHDEDDIVVKHKAKFHKIKVTGETPKLAGWEFVGSITHKGDDVLLNVVPGQDGSKLAQFHKAKADNCDYCHKSRRRTDTFIVKKTETGELKQIGRNCIKDFLGGKDPKQILWQLSIFKTLEELLARASKDSIDEDRMRRSSPHVETDVALGLGLALVERFGFHSSKSESFHPTASQIRMGLWGRPSKHDPKEVQEIYHIARDVLRGGGLDPKHEAKAKAIIEWAKDIPEAEANKEPFLHNIKVLAKGPYVSSKEIGYLAGMIAAYDRAHRHMEQKKIADTKSNQHVGTVGQKLTAKVKVVGKSVIDSMYGASTILRMEDEKGNLIVWFASGVKSDINKDDNLEITGTIKTHDNYKGRNQTVITRAKVKRLDNNA